MHPPDKPNHPLKHLYFLIGKWQTVGKILALSSNSGANIVGTDIYKYVLDENFIEHEVNVYVGKDYMKATEFIA